MTVQGRGREPGSAPPRSPPPPERPRWVQATPQNIVVAGVATVALIAVIVAIASGPNSSNPSQALNAGPVAAPSDAASLQHTVDDVSRYVERARGLKFSHPVSATIYDDKQFDAHLRALGAGRLDANELGNIATLKALGVIPVGYDPAKASADTSSVLGFYDPKTKELAIRGAYVSVYVRKTLVHELTHALQDQSFGLQHLQSAPDQDHALAQQALVEGDARRIESGFVSTLSLTEQDLLERQARQNGDEEFPAGFVLGYQSFPYVVGNHFVTNLVAAGGQAELDKAFSHPPASTKQVLQVRSYLNGELPVPVSLPSAAGPVVSQGTLGEFTLVYVLSQVLPVSEAAVLSAGWAGDAFVTWTSGGGSCTRFRLASLGTLGASDMLVALRTWAAAAPRRTIVDGDPVTVTACV
jgi:hypothetical protein